MKPFNITYRDSKGNEIKLRKINGKDYENENGAILKESFVKKYYTFLRMTQARSEMVINPMNGCKYRVYQ